MLEENQPPTEQLPNPQYKKNKYQIVLATILIALIAVPVGIAIGNKLTPVKQKPTPFPNLAKATPVAHETPSPTCEGLKYINQTPINFSKTVTLDKNTEQRVRLMMGDATFFQQLIGSPEKIYTLKYEDSIKAVAYITGKDPDEDPTAKRSAHLYDLTTGQDKEIFVYHSNKIGEQKQGVGYDSLSDLAFSPDFKEIYMTTNAQIWKYTISTATLDPFFSDQSEINTSVFLEPLLSPDRNNMLLSIGHYEGSSSKMLNVSTKELKQMPFGGYVVGTYPIAWYGSDILALKYGSGISGDEDQDGFCLFSSSGDEKECFKSPELFEIYGTNLNHQKNSITYIATKEENSNQIVCNNVNDPYTIVTVYKNVNRLDLATKQTKTFLNFDSTDSSGAPHELDIFQSVSLDINGEEKVISKILQGTQEKYILNNSDQVNDVSVIDFH